MLLVFLFCRAHGLLLARAMAAAGVSMSDIRAINPTAEELQQADAEG